MGTKHTSKCLQNAGDTEELFVLRAKDLTAPETIRTWIRLNLDNPKMPQEKLQEAERVAQRMETTSGRKLPD